MVTSQLRARPSTPTHRAGTKRQEERLLKQNLDSAGWVPELYRNDRAPGDVAGGELRSARSHHPGRQPPSTGRYGIKTMATIHVSVETGNSTTC